jgi:hypothetical protein
MRRASAVGTLRCTRAPQRHDVGVPAHAGLVKKCWVGQIQFVRTASSNYRHLAMVIAMALMGMMQMTFHEIINVASMRNRFMTATGAMGVCGVVFAARMVGRASRRIRATLVEGVFVYMTLVGTVEMSLVQVIHMTLVLDYGVSAAGAMRMRMLLVRFVIAHFYCSINQELRATRHLPEYSAFEHQFSTITESGEIPELVWS